MILLLKYHWQTHLRKVFKTQRVSYYY